METYGQTVLGGALVGLALAILMILTGRQMSASRMIASLLGGREGLAATSIAFIAGLFIAPSILIAAGYLRPSPIETSWLPLIAGGLLVGIGSRLCDSSLLGAMGMLAKGSARTLPLLLAILVSAVAVTALRQMIMAGGGT